MTYLTHTSSILSANAYFSHSNHNHLTTALDELLSARCNGKSWTIYNKVEGLPMGVKQFSFGTITNTVGGYFYLPYTIANETPPVPVGGQIDSWNADTKTVWVHGVGDGGNTLNIQTVTTTGPGELLPSTWYVGYGGFQERFEKYAIVDIGIQAYTDPVTHNATSFTYRSRWNKYGSIRVHNLNKYTLAFGFEGSSRLYYIPALSVYTFRRETNTSPDDWQLIPSFYFPATLAGDPAWFTAFRNDVNTANIATVGNMQTLYECWSIIKDSCMMSGSVDSNSTSREKDGFTGADPSSSDKLLDWIYHRGDLWSVTLNRVTGEITRKSLTWNGIGTTWDDVTVTNNGDSLVFTSNLALPAGLTYDQFEHDLIPISTNITNGKMLQLKRGDTTVYANATSCDFIGRANNYSPWYSPMGISRTLLTAYRPWDISIATLNHYAVDPVDSDVGSINYNTTLGSYFTVPSTTSGTSNQYNRYKKAQDKIVRESQLAFDCGFWGITKIANTLLNNADYSKTDWLRWRTAQGVQDGNVYGACRTRNVWWRNRMHQVEPECFMTLGSEGNVVYIQHPAVLDITGSTTLGKQWTVTGRPSYSNDIRIQGSAWADLGVQYAGPRVNISTDMLEIIAENLFATGWWNSNRDRVIGQNYAAMTWDESKRILRIPKLIEQFNDLAYAVNNVTGVTPCTIYDLYINPLPSGPNYPFSDTWKDGTGTNRQEAGDCVPADWCYGRYDRDNTLKNWCNTWGITYQTSLPDIADLMNVERSMLLYRVGEADPVIGSIVEYDPVAEHDLNDAIINAANVEWHRNKAFNYEKSLKIFGGAGANANYRWIKETDMATVIGGLGLVYPKQPIGERFDPVVKAFDSVTKITGRSDIASGTVVTPTGYEATIAYRLPNPAGTWVKVIPTNTQFRICEVAGTAKKRYFVTQDMDDHSGFQWLGYELNDTSGESTNYIYYEDSELGWIDLGNAKDIGPQGLLPKNASGSELWKNYTQITENHDNQILLIYCPELSYTFSWPAITPGPLVGSPTINGSFGTTAASGVRTYARVVDPSDFPITKSKLNTWSGTTNTAYNCQYIKLPAYIRNG